MGIRISTSTAQRKAWKSKIKKKIGIVLGKLRLRCEERRQMATSITKFTRVKKAKKQSWTATKSKAEESNQEKAPVSLTIEDFAHATHEAIRSPRREKSTAVHLSNQSQIQPSESSPRRPTLEEKRQHQASRNDCDPQINRWRNYVERKREAKRVGWAETPHRT